ncbi:hypothetical protein E3N88_00152 [Mikania micrantha]|uniref:Uncharacterized protein n=1 Tax=Mikania micrantha TaxID=192012 RepID=A0A5N6PZ13_9ASTR|nr:hypothetical protein E3N88_00152 [Mikania micrantha]
MPHLRSQGPPPELSLPLRSDSRDFSEGSTSEVSVSTPVSAEFSDHTPPFSSSSSTHSSPHFHFIPPMAERRTVHQQATAGFTGLNNPITVPNITNENSLLIIWMQGRWNRGTRVSQRGSTFCRATRQMFIRLSRYATSTQAGKNTPFHSSPNSLLPTTPPPAITPTNTIKPPPAITITFAVDDTSSLNHQPLSSHTYHRTITITSATTAIATTIKHHYHRRTSPTPS